MNPPQTALDRATIDQALDHAIADYAAGSPNRAEAGLRAVLAADPDNLDALNLLGLLLQEQGACRDSIALISRALAIDPDFPEALTNLSRVQRAIGDAASAVRSAERATALDPNLAEAHLQLARGLLDLRRSPEAEAAARRSLLLQPDYSDAASCLGAALLQQDQYEAALTAFQSARPQQVEAQIGAGMALLRLGRVEQALACHQQAAVLAPNLADAHAAHALTLRYSGNPLASAAACRTALALAPDRADLWLLLGGNLAFAGQFAEAAACHARAIKLNPGSAEAWRDLSMIGHSATDADIVQLQDTLADTAAPWAERIAAGFSLGRLLDNAGAFDAAFKACAQANGMVRQYLHQSGKGFDLASLSQQIDWSIQTFQPALFTRLAGLGDPSECPVFIVGMPRSGTTLVEQIAASHQQVFGAGERRDIQDLVTRITGGHTMAQPLTWNTEQAHGLSRDHIARLKAMGSGAARVIDKLPDNIQLLGHIAILFPNARVILCQRDLRDTCLSTFFQQFGEAMPWTLDLADCAARAQEIQRLTDHWRTVLPLPILQVDYEDLVTDPEVQSRRLIDFLGLAWDPACLAPHRTQRTVMTASFWQVRQPVYTGSCNRWQYYRQHLAPLLLGLAGIVPAPEPEDWDRMLADPNAALHAAARHHQAGRLEPAELIYRRLLQRNPEHPATLQFLGLLTLNRGHAAEAVGLLEKSLQIKPDAPAALLDLSRAYRMAGTPGAALAAAQRSLALQAPAADAHAETALASLALGHVGQALAHARQALQADAGSPQALFAQATILTAQDQAAQAEPLWQQLLDMRPQQVEALNGMTNALAAQGRYNEAIGIQRQAIAASPRNPLLLYQLAWLLWRSQDPAAAIEVCQAGLALDPDRTELWLLMANCWMFVGRFSHASDCYRRALALDSDCGAAYAGLMQAGQADPHDEVTPRSAAVVSATTLPVDQRIAAAFAIARDCEKRENYDDAFSAYVEANTLARAARASKDDSIAAIRLYVDWAIETFRPDIFRNARHFANPSELPAYIVGMPRSGTTLVEQIAASHPLVFGEGERTDLAATLGVHQAGGTLHPPEDWDASTVRSRSEALLASLRQRGGAAIRVINKLPDNILWLGHIALLFPNARIIVCRRDLRDVCLSCFSQNFLDPNMAWTDTLEDCAMRAQQIERLLNHWRQVLPARFLEVQYETLVQQLEPQSQRLIQHLGIPWDSACLDFHNTQRAVMTASSWQVRQPLYATSIGRWRRYSQHLGPLFQGLRGLIPEGN